MLNFLTKAYRNWAVHNIIAHPLSYLTGLASQRLGKWVHDVTIPKEGKDV